MLTCANQTAALLARACLAEGVRPMQLPTRYRPHHPSMYDLSRLASSPLIEDCPTGDGRDLLPTYDLWRSLYLLLLYRASTYARMHLIAAVTLPPVLILINALALATLRRMRRDGLLVYPYQAGQAAGDLASALVGAVYLVHESLWLSGSTHNCVSWAWMAFAFWPTYTVCGLSLGSLLLQWHCCRDRLSGIQQPVAYQVSSNSFPEESLHARPGWLPENSRQHCGPS